MERTNAFREAVRKNRKKPCIPFSAGELIVTVITGSIALFSFTVGLLIVLESVTDLRFLAPVFAGVPAFFSLMEKRRSALYFSLAFTISLLIPATASDYNVSQFDQLAWPLFIAQSLAFIGLFIIKCLESLRKDQGQSSYNEQGAVQDNNIETQERLIKGRYAIKSLLGAGASGAVYLASDMQSPGENVQWAIKEISPLHLCDDGSDDAEELFRRECAVLKSLNHPSIPKLIDSFSCDNKLYMVMEHVRGESVENMMKKNGKPLDIARILDIARELAQILKYLHEQSPAPLIYRDLKPSNIVITEKGKIRLIDFGIARHHAPGKTKDTFVYGTPGFSPPEQYGLGQTDERSDIYALGATLYYLLTKEDICQFHFWFPAVSVYNRKVPRPLEALIMKCLRRNPDERHQSADELLSELLQIEKARNGLEEAARKEISWAWFFGASIAIFMASTGLMDNGIMFQCLKVAAPVAVIALFTRAAIVLIAPSLVRSFIRRSQGAVIYERRTLS